MYAIVPTGLKADIFKQNEKKNVKNLRKNNRLLMNSHLYPGITQVFRDTLQINKFSCGYLAINFNRFSIFFFFLFYFFLFKTIHQFNGKSNIWINLILLFIIVAFSSSHTYSCYNIQSIYIHTFVIASVFWNVTAPGTIFPFVGSEPYDEDSSYTRPGGPGGPGGPAGPTT